MIWCFYPSCSVLQECAPGYYRQAVSELNMKGRNRPLIQPCVPCRCNNHSLSCDLETGECLVRKSRSMNLLYPNQTDDKGKISCLRCLNNCVFRDVSTTPQESTATCAPQGIMGRCRAPSVTARCVPVRCGVRGEVTWHSTALFRSFWKYLFD